MREIKFRAWDKDEKRMSLWFNLAMYGVQFEKPEDSLPIVFVTSDQARFELMQYTGLKDKNGKEIYEGDIVQDGRPELRYWIDYKPPAFYLRASRDRAYQIETFRFKDAEVIGNIYEHEHLLTEGR